MDQNDLQKSRLEEKLGVAKETRIPMALLHGFGQGKMPDLGRWRVRISPVMCIDTVSKNNADFPIAVLRQAQNL